MRKVALFLAAILFLSGCASPKAVTKNYLVDNGDKYVSVNLDVDAGRYVSFYEANVVDYIYNSFEDSGLFSSIETSFPRWPVTIQVKYSWEQPDINTGEGFAKTMVSASTLLLVPAMIDEIHKIKARVIVGNAVVGELEYSEKVETALSLYHDPVEDRKNGISRIMDRLFLDIRDKKLIPTVSDIETNMHPVEAPLLSS